MYPLELEFVRLDNPHVGGGARVSLLSWPVEMIGCNGVLPHLCVANTTVDVERILVALTDYPTERTRHWRMCCGITTGDGASQVYLGRWCCRHAVMCLALIWP